ncbi:MAG: diaminopimelate epimerase [Desulfovibrio sp.]|uniref:diaminopimelate epimerase n=1 Tax=Desulfovibrio sp. 7SRBS1 TaxID=3378064 RepID=UPI003B3E5BA6
MGIDFSAAVHFFKMQGSGNDFVVIDNRTAKVAVDDMADWAKSLCRRAFGIAADGLFFLEEAPERDDVDFRWHFYNADGSRAEMCGNGSRCAARLAYELGMAPVEHSIGTDAGVVRAKVLPELGQVKVQLTDPFDERLNIEVGLSDDLNICHFVNSGVPHAVVFTDDVEEVDISAMGSKLRFHEEFAPAGTNANFAQVVDKEHMLLRTYERGVEDETYACGTGACASVFLAHRLGLTGPVVEVTTSGGEKLVVDVTDGKLFLQGGAEITFQGEANLTSLGLA